MKTKLRYFEEKYSLILIQNLIKYNLMWMTALFRSGSPFNK